jgi:hypothetical protein
VQSRQFSFHGRSRVLEMGIFAAPADLSSFFGFGEAIEFEGDSAL